MLPPDTEILPETAASNSISKRVCGLDPADPEALTEASFLKSKKFILRGLPSQQDR